MDPIYVIRDAPGVGRYVGVTNLSLAVRLTKHISKARSSKETYHSLNWFRSLDYVPMIEVIEWVLPSDRVEREMYWIALFRDYGHRLVNSTDGGEGTTGRRNSPEACAKMSAAKAGRKQRPEDVEKRAAALRGRKYSPEHCARISAAKTGVLRVDNASGFVGVRQHYKKWRASFKRRQIGTFQKIEDAVFARALTIALEEK